jgi:hypothetical protein
MPVRADVCRTHAHIRAGASLVSTQLNDHASAISFGTCPTQNTPSTAPQEGQKAIATPAPDLGARKDTCWTSSLQDGHFGLIDFIDSDFFLSFDYQDPGYSAKTNVSSEGKVTTSVQTKSPSTSGDSLESEYSNLAPQRSSSVIAPDSSITILPVSADASLIKTEIPPAIEIISFCEVGQSCTNIKAISGGSGSSRHFFKIKNASSQEVMFVLYAHVMGLQQAKHAAARFQWTLQRPLPQLLEVIDELDRNCSARRAKCKGTG